MGLILFLSETFNQSLLENLVMTPLSPLCDPWHSFSHDPSKVRSRRSEYQINYNSKNVGILEETENSVGCNLPAQFLIDCRLLS